jgi:hypothetical protein
VFPASNGTINDRLTGKDVEGSGRGLFRYIITVLGEIRKSNKDFSQVHAEGA